MLISSISSRVVEESPFALPVRKRTKLSKKAASEAETQEEASTQQKEVLSYKSSVTSLEDLKEDIKAGAALVEELQKATVLSNHVLYLFHLTFFSSIIL